MNIEVSAVTVQIWVYTFGIRATIMWITTIIFLELIKLVRLSRNYFERVSRILSLRQDLGQVLHLEVR
jgi:hypothetical protein